MKNKKLYFLILKLTFASIIIFWAFSYFLTENKPINVPIYAEINFNNHLYLIPIIILNYYLIFKQTQKKTNRKNLFTIFILGLSLILLFNSLKKGLPFYHSLKHPNDYYHDALKIKNLKKSLESFSRRIFYHRLHTRTHPPGPVVFHFLLNSIFPSQKIFNGLIITALSSAVMFVVFKISSLAEVKNKNLLLLLFFSSPGILIYSAVCLDMIFALLISLSIYFVLKLKRTVNFQTIFLGSLTIFLASFFHYASIVIPLFTFLLIVFGYRKKSFLFSNLVTAFLVIFYYSILTTVFNFNLYQNFNASNRYNTMQNPAFFMTVKRYFYGISSNFIEYIIFLGIPIFALLIINLIKNKERKYYSALLLPVIIGNLAGIFKSTGWTGETGRVWLFLTPLIISGLNIKNHKILKITALLSFTQSFIMQLTLNTFW